MKQKQNYNVSLAAVIFKPCHQKTKRGGFKAFSCSTKLGMKFIMLMNVKMPTIVGIVTFISMINRTSERLKARNIFIYPYYRFSCSVGLSMKKVYNHGACL